MSTTCPYVKRFKPAVKSTPLSKNYVLKTKAAQFQANIFGESDNLVKDFDEEKLTFNQKVLSEYNKNNLLIVS